MRRRRGTGFGTIPRFEQFGKRLRTACTAAYFNQRADDVAHHVAEEPGSLNGKDKIFFLAGLRYGGRHKDKSVRLTGALHRTTTATPAPTVGTQEYRAMIAQFSL